MNFVAADALWGLLGGLLIGLSAALMLLGAGRIAGISGIAGALVSGRPTGATGENIAFLAGLIGAPLLHALAAGAPAIGITGQVPLLIAGGLLVGFGARMGGGCTSGHGVCGMTRLSARSLIATPVFMVAAALAVFALRHVFGG